jgi:glycosyltransferase involved in cell wall biosynthesis
MRDKKCLDVLTVTSNDLGISWGPAIHYLELWNEAVQLKGAPIRIQGIAPSWTGRCTIRDPAFPLKIIKVPSIRRFRQVFYDVVLSISTLARMTRVDVVYIRLSHWHLFIIFLLMISKKFFVVELNGLALEDSRSSRNKKIISWLVSRQEKWLVENADVNICVSNGIKRSISARYNLKGRSFTVLNGVSEQFFKKESSSENLVPINKLKILYVGTFTPWDGAGDIIDLAEHFPEVDFLMVGDGDLRGAMEKNAPANVAFLGKVEYSALPDIYKKAHAGIVLYEFERHRNVEVSSIKTLEYVASELPVFTTDVPGQEFIKQEKIGYLLGESECLIKAFSDFIKDIALYKESYTGKKEKFKSQFGWRRTARETIGCIKNVFDDPLVDKKT